MHSEVLLLQFHVSTLHVEVPSLCSIQLPSEVLLQQFYILTLHVGDGSNIAMVTTSTCTKHAKDAFVQMYIGGVLEAPKSNHYIHI